MTSTTDQIHRSHTAAALCAAAVLAFPLHAQIDQQNPGVPAHEGLVAIFYQFHADSTFRQRTEGFPPPLLVVNGVDIGTLELRSLVPVVLLPDDRVGIVEKDEFDGERLVVMSIER